MIDEGRFGVNNLDEIAPLPEPVDPFAAYDAERTLATRLICAGYDPLSAQIKVRSVLRQLALAWGLQPPAGAAPDFLPDGIRAADSLELRRKFRARPLEDYAPGEAVRWRDEDGRWIGASCAGTRQDALLLEVDPCAQRWVSETDPVRVQPAKVVVGG